MERMLTAKVYQVVLAIMLFLAIHAASVDREYRKLIGVEVLHPGLTARYAGERFGVVLNAGLDFHGRVWIREESHFSDQSDMLQLFGRLNVFRCGKDLAVHVTAGAERKFPYFLGAGLSFYKEIDGGYHFFLDTDLAYIRSRLDFSYYEFGYPSGQRLQIGFLKGF